MSDRHLYLVYRSHYDGPLSKSVISLEAESILAWFQSSWSVALEAESEDAAYAIGEEITGTSLYGFGSIFRAIHENQLKPPETWRQLYKILQQHLYVEGEIKMNERTLRVLTDDDEVQLAYYFFDSEWAAAHPERTAYLLQEDWRLPDGEGPGGFTPPVKVQDLLPAEKLPPGEGETFAALMTFEDSESLGALQLYRFPGVRLPDLAAHLQSVRPKARRSRAYGHVRTVSWPLELRLLRALLRPGELELSEALARVARYPLMEIAGSELTSGLGLGTPEEAARELERLAKKHTSGGDPEQSLISVGRHIAQLCHHAHSFFGYQQWVLFDDLWASAHPDLAASLMRYASGWDPLR